METADAIKVLQAEHGADCSVMSIGPAGENLVRFANIMNENERAAGRGGMGAVAGSKNLKAIVIKADKKNQPKPADRAAFKVADKKALAQIMNEAVVTAPRKGGLSVYGTNVLMNMTNVVGALPTKNSQSTSFVDAELISGEWVKENILIDDPTCHACPVACKKEFEITEGKYKVKGESFEYEPAWALGGNCLNGNAASIAYMIVQCNRFGMDSIEMGNVLSMTMEATDKGYTNGNGIAWGDTDAMVDLIERIGYRKDDFAWKLGEGTYLGAVSFGDPDIAMTVKGQAIPAYDPRGIKGMGIGYATSNRGACHLRAYTPAAEIVGNVLGPAELTDRMAWEGKGKLTMIFQNVHTMTDCLDLCKFSTFAESLDSFAEQFSTFTGMPVTAGDLLTVGDRVYNLERYYNNLAGFREGSDYLPKRFSTAAGGWRGLGRQSLRDRSDAGRVLCRARLGKRRRAGEQVEGVGDSLVAGWQVAGGADRKWVAPAPTRTLPNRKAGRRRCDPLGYCHLTAACTHCTCDLPLQPERLLATAASRRSGCPAQVSMEARPSTRSSSTCVKVSLTGACRPSSRALAATAPLSQETSDRPRRFGCKS